MLAGDEIKRGRTLGSKFDHDCIVLFDKADNQFRIHVEEIVKMAQKCMFSTETRRVHTYLHLEE